MSRPGEPSESLTSSRAGLLVPVPGEDRPRLLRTKLGLRSPRLGMVPRPDLLAELDAGLTGPLALVSAPAGFGKTTLVAQWLADRGLRAGWLTLEAADNDAARFCRYLLAAAEPLLAEDDSQVSALLAEPQLAPESVMVALVNGLTALPVPAVLVLDDYEAITAGAIHDAVGWLLEHLPPLLHLVLLSRADPPLPLALLRARGDLCEVRAEQLRFDAAEAAAFLNGVMGLRLAEADIARLTERTEGWPAGLQLAAISLQKHPDATAFIKAFSGSHRFVLDYLLQEILERQQPEVRRFLLDTSILDRLCGPLCEAVTGQPGAQSSLEHLERANLFVVPLDEERRWYRYHHLFADCLRSHLQRTEPALPSRLHRRAAEWYATNGLEAEAVEHALKADDPAYAAGLVESVGFNLLVRSEFATVRRWLDLLSSDHIERSASLCVFSGWTLVEAFVVDRARPWLDRPADVDLPPHLRLLRAALRARLRWLHGEPGEARPLGSEELIDLSAEIADPSLGAYLLLYASAQIGEALRLQGHLNQAVRTYRDTLRRTEHVDPDARFLAARSFAELGLGRLLYEQDDLEAAEDHLTNGIELARRARNDQYAAWGAMFLPPLRQAQGRDPEARTLIDEAEQSARRRGVGAEVAWCAAQRARLMRTAGDIESVAAWAREYRAGVEREAASEAPLGYVEEFVAATYVRALLALGRIGEAAHLLERLLARTDAAGQTGHTIELLALVALASCAAGDRARSFGALEQSLMLAEPEGYVRIFVDEGPPLASLLAEGTERWPGVSQSYLRRLREAAGRGVSVHTLGSPTRGASGSLIEPLTPRELEVLGLLAAGRSNSQIAAELFVSVNTAKTHVHALCAKLGAENRGHAVARARELGLLP